MRYVVQYTKPLSVQFIAVWQFYCRRRRSDSGLHDIYIYMTICEYATADGAKLSRSALCTERCKSKIYSTVNLKSTSQQTALADSCWNSSFKQNSWRLGMTVIVITCRFLGQRFDFGSCPIFRHCHMLKVN